MAKDYYSMLNDRRNTLKKDDEKKTYASSSGSRDYYGQLGKLRMENTIGFDTLESDLSDLGTTVGNIYSGWQTQETMLNTRKAVETMHSRLSTYQDYRNQYGSDLADLSEVYNGYQSVLDDWDNVTEVYGSYKNADAFNTAKKKVQMGQQFEGLTYDEVQEQMNKYKQGSDEYNFLSEYTGYTDLAEFDKALGSTSKNGKYYSALETARNKWELDNAYDKYKHYTEVEDFAEKSQYQDSAKRDGLLAKLGFDGSDETYEYINDVNGARNEIIAKYKEGNEATEMEQHGYEYMTDEEKAMYNYLYSTDKKLADQYLKDMEISLNKRVYDKSTETWEQWSDDSALASIGMDLATPVLNLAGGMGSALETVKEVATGREYNPYAPGRMAANAGADMRKYVGDNIEESTNGAVRFLHDTAFSMADSGLRTATLGKLGTVVAGMGAYQQTAKDLKESGASDAQTQSVAVISGAAELVFEYIGIDNLFKINNADSAKNIIKSALKQAGAEGLEETGTEIVNMLADTLIRGDNSELIGQYHDMIERGYSEEEANTAVASQIGKQIALAALGGALSGAGMGSIYGTVQYSDLKDLGAAIRDNETIEDLKGIGTELGNDSYKQYLELIESGNISNAQLGNFYTQVEADTRSTLNTERGKAVMRAVADMANEMGDSKNSGIIASAIQKKIDRQKLSAEEKSALKTDTAKAITAEMKKSGQLNFDVADSLTDASIMHKRVTDVFNMSKKEEHERQQRAKELTKGEETKVGDEAAKVTGIRMEDGATTVLTDRGEVLADEAILSATDAELVSYAEIMGAEKGNLFISQYDGKTDVSDYQKSFNLAYAYGEAGVGADNVLANKGALTEAQASEIYKNAVTIKANARQTAIDEITKKYRNLTVTKGEFDDSIIDYDSTSTDGSKVNWNTLTSKQREAVTFAKAFSQATGVNIRFIKSKVVNGEHKGKNGSYNPNTNTIEIDVYAGRMDAKTAVDAIIPTISHEVTHWMKAKSPKAFSKLQEQIMNTLALDDGMSMEDRINEEMARINRNHPKKNVTPEDAVDEIMARACEDMLSNSEKARELLDGLSEAEKKSFVTKVKETFDNLMKWVNELLGQYKSESKEAEFLRGYGDALKEAQKLWDQAFAEAVKANQALQMEGKTAEKVINESLEKIGLHFDAKTESVAPQNSERTWSESEYVQEREKAVNQLSKTLGISKEEAGKYIDDVNSIARLIADDRARLDYEPSEGRSAFVSNVEYGGSIDFSTLCKKRRLYTGTISAIQEALPNTALLPEEYLAIRNMLLDRGYEATCGLCYVEGSRTMMGQYTKQFIEKYAKTNPPYVPTMAEMNTPDGQERIRFEHPEVYDKYVYFMNHYGRIDENDKAIFASQQKPKMYTMRTDYKHEIASKFKKADKVRDKNLNGGIRLQSFSDFEIVHLIDCMQVIMDMSKVGLAGQAYTKVPEFADALGNTGLKINLSLIAKGVDSEGNLIFDDVEGMPHENAMQLRNKYSSNVGTVLVVFNRQQLESALKNPNIDYVLPFHRSQWKKAQYDLIGLPQDTEDFTNYQNEKGAKGNIMPNSYWDFQKSGRANAEKYLSMCNLDGRTPKFPFLLEKNSDGTYSLPKGAIGDNYFKLLIDFKMYDNSGKGSPQLPVKPNFSMEESRKMLEDYRGGHSKFPVARDIVDEFVAEYKQNHPKEQYSDRDYMDAVNRGDMETAQKMVDEAAKKAGYDVTPLFHGTGKFGFTKFDPAFSDDKSSFFLSDNALVSETYSGGKGKTRIADRSPISYDDLEDASPETILKLLKENVDRNIEIVSEEEHSRIVEENRDDLRTALSNLKKNIAKAKSDNERIKKISDDLIRHLEEMIEASNYNDFMDANANYDERMWALKWEDGDICDIILDDTHWYIQSAYRNLTTFLDNTMYKGNADLAKQKGSEYFTELEAITELHKNLFKGVYKLYAKPGKQFVVNADGNNWNRLDGRVIGKYGDVRTRDVAEYAKNNGYDSVVIKDVRDNADYTYSGTSNVYIYFDSNRLKSADPVTYDDSGNIIPLSKRFNAENVDIRYSDREIDSWLDGLSIDDLIAELGFDGFDITDTKEKVKVERRVDEVNKRLKQIGLSFNGTKSLAWTDERIEKYLGGGYYGSSNPKYAKAYIAYMTPKQFLNLTMGGKTTTVDMIQNESASYGELDIEKLGGSSPMFLEIDEGRVWSKVVGHEGRHRMYLLGKAGFERVPVLLFDYKTKHDKTPKDEMKLIAQRYNDTDLISKSRNTAIGEVIPFSQGNKDLIKQKFGSGMEADIHYSDRDTDYIDSRTLLSNALESVAQTDDERDLLTEYRKNIDIISIKESELSEITAQIKELSFAKGERDAKKLEYLKSRAEKIRNSINYFDKKLLSLEAASPLKAVVDRERAKARKKAYEKNREYTKQTMSSYKEQLEKKAKIESITQKALVLNKWMLKNSKDEHIPEAMKPVVTHLLKAIDFSSKQYLGMRGGQYKGMPTQKDISLAQALANIQQMMSSCEVDGEVLYELYGADLDTDMKDLVKSVNLYMRTVGDNAYVLNQMTADELHKLDKIVGAIKASVTKMNQFHVVNTKKSIAHVAQSGMVYMDSLGQAKLHKSKLGKGISQMLNWGNATPYYAFKRFGEGGEMVYEALMDGWDNFSFRIKEVIDYAEATYSKEEVKKWSEEVKAFEILLPATKAQLADPNFKGNKQKIQLTTAQIMSLYCLQKREQAKGHIMGGGIRIADIETKKGVISQSDGAVLTEKELDKITGSLTKDHIRVADALQKFMNEECAEWGNEISMKRFGYKAFGEPNYFPIRSDENVTGDDTPKEMEKSLYRLLNMSFTKALTDKANNRIVVDNIFDVFAQHTSEMAKYNALALPVLDAVRWFNYKEKGEKIDGHFKTIGIRQSMEKAFGKDANNFVRTFLEDINGAENVARDGVANVLLSNTKIASVAFNLKVAALQPTSYLRASAVIDPKYLKKISSPSDIKRGIEKSEKWCGMALWKSLGFIDINVQRGVAELIKHDQSTKDKLTDVSMKGAEMADKVTIGCLWNACEAEVKATRTDLKVGSDEYYTAVGKRLREVIYATQVVDSTMTRSHMMRSGDKFDKVLTNFASEPTLAYNMLMDVFYDWKLTERRFGKSEAFARHKGKMMRVATAYTVTNLVTSLLETAFEAYRDDDEEEEEFVDYVVSFFQSFGSNMGISTKIPYLKDLVSILQGFTSKRTDTQWMQNLVYALKDWKKIFSGEGNVYKAAYRTFSAISQLSGVALGNAMRELASVWNATIGSVYPSLKLYK